MNKEILKKILSVFLICQLTFTGLILQPQVAKAVSGVPQIIAYQGRLTDSAGELLGGDDGTAYYFKFSIYDNATAGSGTKLWPTTAPSSTSATVTNGVFTVNIGDTDAGYPDALDYDFQTNRDVYLQVEVSSDNVTFEALDPRQRITSAGFAVNAGTLGGFTASQSPTGNQIPVLNSGNLIIAGSLTTGATTTFNTVVYTWPGSDGSNGQFLSTDGSGALSWSTVTIPDHWSANGSYIYSSSTASGVGIGTDTPSTTLHVVGTFRASATTTLDTGSLVSNVADGSSAVAYNFNTANALSTTGAKIASFKNNGTEKAYVDKDGVYTANLVQVGAQSAAPVSGVSLFYEAPGSSKTAGLYFEQGGVTGRGGLMRWYKYNNSSDKIGFYLNAGGKTTDTPIIYAEQGNSQANQATYFGLPTGVLSGVKLGLDAEISGTTYDGSNRGTPADTYFTKSAASGGNFSTFYDGTEVQRFSSSTNFAIVPNTVIGGAITDTASTTLHVVGTLRTSATSTFDTGVLVSGVADGATAKAFTLNSVALSTSGAKLLSLQNNGTEKASVDKDGNLYLGGLTTAYLTTANQGGVEHIKVEGKLGFGSTGHVVYLESTGSQGVNVKGISGATLMQWDKESQTTINAYGLALSANLPLVFDNRGGDTKITKTSASGGNWNFAYDSDVAARFDTDGFSVASSTLIGVLGQASTTLHVVGDFKVTATSTFEGPAIFADADLGAIRFETDAGQVSWVDLPVSSSADSGSVQSYTAQLDGNPMISVYAEADGSGGTTNRRVGIGTFVPSSTLHVVGTLQATATTTLDSSLIVDTDTLFVNSVTNQVGVGTLSPSTTLHVVGDFRTTATTTLATSGGRVGVGTLNPSSTLHIVGTLRTSATSTFDTGVLVSGVVDGASAIGYKFMNSNALTTGGSSVAVFYEDAGTTEVLRIRGGAEPSWTGTSNRLMLGGTSGGWFSYVKSGTYSGNYNWDIKSGHGALTENTTGIAGFNTGWFTTQANVKLGLDSSLVGTGQAPDSYFIKSLATGGNFSTFYDGTEVLRIASTTNYAIVPNTVIGGAITDTASTTLHVVGDFRVSATSTFDATSTFSGPAIFSELNLGASFFDTDAGMVSWIDMPVTTSSSLGTVQSYTAQIDGNPLLTVYSESNGAGGIRNQGVSIGTSTVSNVFQVASTTAMFLTVGHDGSVVVGSPTGGAKGAGTVNAVAVYDDNTLLTDWVFDLYFDGELREEDLELHDGYEIMSVDQMTAYIEENRHLPTIKGRDSWVEEGGFSLGSLASMLWQTAETNAIYITELNTRIKELEEILGIENEVVLQGSSSQLDANTSIEVRDGVFNGKLVVLGHSTFNEDTIGQAEIGSNDMTVRVEFEKEYSGLPIVTATVVDNLGDFRYSVMNVSTEGFNIDVSSAQSSKILFNWHAFNSDDRTKVFKSDGSYSYVNIVVVESPDEEEIVIIVPEVEETIEEVVKEEPEEVVEEEVIEEEEVTEEEDVIEEEIEEVIEEVVEETVEEETTEEVVEEEPEEVVEEEVLVEEVTEEETLVEEVIEEEVTEEVVEETTEEVLEEVIEDEPEEIVEEAIEEVTEEVSSEN